MKKKRISFQESWYRALSELADEQRLNCLDAVFRYAFYGEAPSDPITRAMTSVMFDGISHQEEVSETRRVVAISRWHSLQKSRGNDSESRAESSNQEIPGE